MRRRRHAQQEAELGSSEIKSHKCYRLNGYKEISLMDIRSGWL